MNQEEHIKGLKEQQNELLAKYQKVSAEVTELRDTILKVQGAIDYLTSVGVTCEEPTEEELTEEETTKEE